MTMPPSNIPLQAAIAVFNATPTPEATRAIYESLVNATLVVLPTQQENEVIEDITQSARGDGPKPYHLLKGPQGRLAVPAFTDPQSVLFRYPQGGEMIFLTTRQIAGSIAGTTKTLVLNPTREMPSGIHIPREALLYLARGEVPPT